MILRQRRQIGAYGLCRDDAGRVLLVRAAGDPAWRLPGGRIEHGEHPALAVARETRAETGLRVRVIAPRNVVTDLDPSPDLDEVCHHDRIVFDVGVIGGRRRAGAAASLDQVGWADAADLAGLPLAPFAAVPLGGPTAPRPPVDLRSTVPVPVGPRRQRFAAYGLVTDPAGRVLLTQIATGYPGAGYWHLPGGGTHFGEAAIDGLARELREETNQTGLVGRLLDASHWHRRAAEGPENSKLDWHGVRVVYRVRVPDPTPPQILDQGGSTVDVGWFDLPAARRLPLTGLARETIRRHLRPSRRQPARAAPVSRGS